MLCLSADEMFYSNQILAKKGALGNIWLAAHWDKRLSKSQIFQTDIAKSCQGITDPKVPLALRVSGHLLLGLVRIYSRKVKYLFADCSDALVKIKMAFRPGVVNLPEGSTTAPSAAITLAGFGTFDGEMEDLGGDDALDAPVADPLGTNEWALVGNQADDKGVLMVGYDEIGGFGDDDRFGGGYGDTSGDPAFAASRSRRGRTSLSTDGGPDQWRAGGDTTADITGDVSFGGGLDDGQFGGVEMGEFGGEGAGGARRESMLSMGGDIDFGGADIDMGDGGFGNADFGSPDIRLADGGGGAEITEADLQEDDDAAAGAGAGARSKAAAKRKFHQVDSKVILSNETLREWLYNPEFSTVAPYKSAKRRAKDMKDEKDARRRRHLGWSGNEVLPPTTFGPRPDALKIIESLHTGKHGIPLLTEEEKAERDADLSGEQVPATPGYLNKTGDTQFNADMGYEDFGGQELGGYEDDFNPPVDDTGIGGADEGVADGGFGDAEMDAGGEEGRLGLSVSGNSGKSALEAEPLADSAGPSGKWNTRTKRVLETLNSSLEEKDSITYRELAGKSSRHTVAGCFFELLVLKSWDVVDVDQAEPYDDIHISKNAEKFDEAVVEMTAEA